jgi:integrase/recombinase XerD
MSKEGKAKVLSKKEFKGVIEMARIKPHAKRNVALLYMSFGLGLRAKEMASLRIKDITGSDEKLLDEINLTKDMTKGGKQRHAFLTNKKVRDTLTKYLKERRVHRQN